ncbi:hypothetical protein QJQ45_000932 [Haematococcus lacustris]|nr:hypothetical protein QJQ45_000932 [Haematococcus lacustris]
MRCPVVKGDQPQERVPPESNGLKATARKAEAIAKEVQAENELLMTEAQLLHAIEEVFAAKMHNLEEKHQHLQAAHRQLRLDNESLEAVIEQCNLAVTIARRDVHRLEAQLCKFQRRPLLTRKQRQQLQILKQTGVSIEVLRRWADSNCSRLDTHGRPGGTTVQPTPRPSPPEPTPGPSPPEPCDPFIPTQEASPGQPAARTAAYTAQQYLSTARLMLKTQVSRRRLSTCRRLFITEQCVVANTHRPGERTTVSRQLRVVYKYLRQRTLGSDLAGAAGQHQRLTAQITDVLAIVPLPCATAEAHVKVIMRELERNGLQGVHIASMTADSASVNMGGHSGVIAQLSDVRMPLQNTAIRAQPCYSHGLHNTLLAGLTALGAGIKAAIEDIASLLAQHWGELSLARSGAKPETPCDTRWASYTTAAASVIRVWRLAGEAVARVVESHRERSPPWAVTLSGYFKDTDLLLKICVVHCKAMSSYYEQHVQMQNALPGLFAALGSSDTTTRWEAAQEVVNHAEMMQQQQEDQQQQQGVEGQQQKRTRQRLPMCDPRVWDAHGTWEKHEKQICAMADMQELSEQDQQQLQSHLEVYYLACPVSNAPVESLLQLLKHGTGMFMELPALLELMSMRTHIDAIGGVDVLDFAQRLPELRKEVRREEAAAAMARRIAKAEIKAAAATHRVGQVVVDVGDHEGQHRLSAAYALTYDGRDYSHTTVEEAEKLSVRELQAYLRFHQQELMKGWLKPKLKGLVMAHICNTVAALHGDELGVAAAVGPSSSNSSPAAAPGAAAVAAHELGLPRIGKGLAEQREFVFNPATQIGVGIDPGVTQAVSAASGVWDPATGQLLADQLCQWKLTKGQVKHGSGLNNARRDTERWLAPIKPHLQHLAAASSAGTSLEANLKHITVTLATWDAVWEVYLDPKWAEQRLRLYGAQDRTLEQFFKKLEEDMAEVSMERHGRAKQLVVFFGAASIGTMGGWGADAVLRACCKVVCRPRGTDQRRGRVVLVDEHRTSRVSSAVNGQQPCERQLNKRRTTRPAGWKPPAGQVDPRLLRPAWSQLRDQPVRGMMWCPVVAPRKPPQAPRSSQEASQAAASELGPSTPLPAKRSKRTKAEPEAAEPSQPTKGKGKGKGKAAKAKPAPQPGRWVDRDCNATLNMQRIGESKWRPLELCFWPEQRALPAKGKEYPGLGYNRLRDKPLKAQQQQQQQQEQPAEAQ